MDAGLLQFAGPDDVVGLVEAGFDLHEREHLLARLGGIDEGLHDGTVAGSAVERLFDRQHVRVARRLLQEGLHAGRERFVRMMHEHVRLADRREDIRLLRGVPGLERDRRRGHVRRVAQFGAVDPRKVEQSAQVQRSRQPVHLLLGDVEFLDEKVEREIVHVVGDLQPDRRSEPASHQLGFEHLDEVLGLVLLDDHVLVAGEPERVMVQDLHPREQVAQVVRDQVLERQIAHEVAVPGHLDEPGQHGRHFQAGELLPSAAGVADPDREVEGQARDVRERVRGVDRERHEHREHLGLEVLVEPVSVGLVQIAPGQHVDAGLGQSGLDPLLPRVGMPALEPVGGSRDIGQHLLRGAAGVGRHRQTRHDAALETGDPDHEELVEVAAEDGQEVRALQDRQARVLGQFQHALVEREPAQLPVDVPVLGQFGVGCGGGQVEIVVVGVAEPGVEHVLSDHHLIIAARRDAGMNAVSPRASAAVPGSDRPRTR